jgi:hypothetical protein
MLARLMQNDPAQLAVMLEEVSGVLKAAPRKKVFGFARCQLAKRCVYEGYG